MIDFHTHPDRYRHWQLTVDGNVATLALNVDEQQGLAPGYELKLNSYDLGVDIELHDAVERLRFEHPEVGAVVITSGRDDIFCAGANIRMLGVASHQHKVNFCKFTNETRNGIEDASAHSGQVWISALNGTASGGGYELALATEHIMLVDDGNSAVSLPEVPLLAVLPGTGGLTRLVDKRRVRRDHADFLCTVAEGVKGKRAVAWKLIDEIAPRSRFAEAVAERAAAIAATSDRPAGRPGVTLAPLAVDHEADHVRYRHVTIDIDRRLRSATLTVHAPEGEQPATPEAIDAAGCDWWPLAMARELDDAILHLRFNEPEIGTWVLRTRGDGDAVAAVDATLLAHADDWLVREVRLLLRRTLKRLDVSARSLIALADPGSCFTGSLLELLLAADRSFMLDGNLEAPVDPDATLRVTGMNLGPLAMCNGLSRLQTRFLGDDAQIATIAARAGEPLDAAAAETLGLVTFIPDDIDWDDEVRLAIEERASFSPDALTGMEASLRFAGPETLETKIFGRLSAWQNWIFQRPNAVGSNGALKLYGTGRKSVFDMERV